MPIYTFVSVSPDAYGRRDPRSRDGGSIVASLVPAAVAAYPRSVLAALAARLDRHIADLMLARARRRWPLLRVLPRACVRPLIVPAAAAARQDLLHGAVIFAGAVLLLLIVVF